ncbi:MAG: DNA-directed RNA polymerase, partial [Candidatus Thermoplasmatota archaeon]
MYLLLEQEDVIRIPPEKLSENLKKVTTEVTRETFEGKLANGIFNLLVIDVKGVEECRIVPGDAGVYQKVKFTTLAFKPELQEIVEGLVCEILEFGAFVRLGPLDGLVHISQVMDDRIS